VSEDVSENKTAAETQRPEEPADLVDADAPEQGDPSGAEAVDEVPSAVEEDPLATALEENKRLRDQLLRTAADFDNFRKRTKREVTEANERGREDLLKELLPVFDNLERASEHAKSATDVTALLDGIELVTKQFVDTLARAGIEKINALGQPFDPSLHEAIQQIETSDVPAGSVANQVQAGYRLGGRLLRPCMVVVAKAPSA